MGIPIELQNVQQWTHSINTERLRHPRHHHYIPDGGMHYLSAVSRAKQMGVDFGFYTTMDDLYFMGDIDGMANPESIDDLPPLLRTLVTDHGMYVEGSPSKLGIRLIGRLPKEGKAQLGKSQHAAHIDLDCMPGKWGFSKKLKKDVLKKEAKIVMGAPWMRMTGQQTSYSADTIGEVSLETLSTVFTISYLEESTEITPEMLGIDVDAPKPVPVVTDVKLAPFREFKQAVLGLTFDENVRLQRAYKKVFKEEFEAYAYWLKVLMAIHDYSVESAMKIECIQLAVEWSATDKSGAYQGSDEIVTKFLSFDSMKHNVISSHSIFALQDANTIIWPKRKPLTKSDKARGLRHIDAGPINGEYDNFLAMTDFFNLHLYHDINAPAKMYVTGDEDIIKKYFGSLATRMYFEKYRGIFDTKNLIPAFHILSQAMGFLNLNHNHTSQHLGNWRFQIKKKIDMVRMYFDTPYDDLPEEYQSKPIHYARSTVDALFGCLTIDHQTDDHEREEALYKKYVKSWLMGMVRGLYWPDSIHMNNCVLLLTGKEQIRKTSFFRYMLPPHMRRERIAATPHGFSSENQMRDIYKLAAGNSLVYFDELEGYLTTATESNFKKLIDGNPQKFMDKYETVESDIRPLAIYGGTSNKRKFNLSNSGSRRIFHIPVSWVDTEVQDTLCWHKIINDLKQEMKDAPKDKPPWLLTRNELEYQEMLHHGITSENRWDMILKEMYDFNQPCFITPASTSIPNFKLRENPYFRNTKTVIEEVAQYTNFRDVPTRPQITNALERVCGPWTDSKGKTRGFSSPPMQILNGLASFSNRFKEWVLPPARNPYEEEDME